MKFTVYQNSRRGGREINEDRLGYSYTREAVLLVLADGMGGHPEGEKAAELAVAVFNQRFLAAAKPDLDDVHRFLVDALHAANRAILDYAVEHQMTDNPRTTLVAAVLQAGRLCTIHCGDSRLYWVRGGRVLARTRDHSYTEKSELFAKKQLTQPALNRNVLFTCLGSPAVPLFDVSQPAPLHQGDRLLLCSDGLWGVLADETIGAGLADGTIKETVLRLTDWALDRGGKSGDNVSLLALDWETPDEFEPTHVISTEDISEYGFSSTLHQNADDLEGELDDFDDDAIERSIAEINQAIQRTAVLHAHLNKDHKKS
jgi:PPM family protein phosphatase